MFTKRLVEKGYKVIDPGRFPHKTPDYTSFIDTWKKEKVEILTGVQPPPDFAAAWRQCFQQGFIPKMSTHGKPILFPSAVQAIGGNLPSGLTTCVWWSPHHPFKSSIAGYSAKDLVMRGQRKRKTMDPAYRFHLCHFRSSGRRTEESGHS
jgi:branched-chain amino acid transport system substrate-binding protein